jgi:hypothetical protein
MQRAVTTRPPPAGGPRHDPLWTELDAGRGMWENVPSTVRQAFRTLLTQADEAHHRMAFLTSEAADKETKNDARMTRLEQSQAVREQGERSLREETATMKR